MVGNEAVNLHEIGANLMLVDYRGYGLSGTRISPDEPTVDEDAEATLNYLLRNRESQLPMYSCRVDRLAAARPRILLRTISDWAG